MRNHLGSAWISCLRSRSDPYPVPRVTLSVTATAIVFMRMMQKMAVVVVVVASGLAIKWWNDAVLLDETATHLDRVVERLNLTNAHLSHTMIREGLTLSPEQLSAIKREVVFVNHLAEKRAFSWSRLLADLETTLPPRMALRTVRLNFQDSTVALHGSAASLQEINSFMTSLEHHAAFRHAALTSHRQEQPESQPPRPLRTSATEQILPSTGRGVEFELTVVYRPSF